MPMLPTLSVLAAIWFFSVPILKCEHLSEEDVTINGEFCFDWPLDTISSFSNWILFIVGFCTLFTSDIFGVLLWMIGWPEDMLPEWGLAVTIGNTELCFGEEIFIKGSKYFSVLSLNNCCTRVVLSKQLPSWYLFKFNKEESQGVKFDKDWSIIDVLFFELFTLNDTSSCNILENSDSLKQNNKM